MQNTLYSLNLGSTCTLPLTRLVGRIAACCGVSTSMLDSKAMNTTTAVTTPLAIVDYCTLLSPQCVTHFPLMPPHGLDIFLYAHCWPMDKFTLQGVSLDEHRYIKKSMRGRRVA